MRPLQRPEKSAAEIAELPALGTTQCSAHVREHGHAFAPETLVYLMRQATALRNTALFEMCGRFLIGQPTQGGSWSGGHCEPIIASLSRAHGFARDIDLRTAFRAQCLGKAFMAIHAGRDKKPYWEERFGDALWTSCIDVARSLRRPRQKEMEAGLAASDDADIDNFDRGEPLLDETILAELAKPHHQAAVLAAVRALSPRQAEAATLRWMEGRHIEGNGHDTVAAIMGITPRAVHAHLDKAFGALRANPTLRHIWQGEL